MEICEDKKNHSEVEELEEMDLQDLDSQILAL